MPIVRLSEPAFETYENIKTVRKLIKGVCVRVIMCLCKLINTYVAAKKLTKTVLAGPSVLPFGTTGENYFWQLNETWFIDI